MLRYLILFTGLLHRASLELEIIRQKPTQFGDSPFWCVIRQSLFYVDFFGVDYDILRYDYGEGKIYAAKIENAPPNAAFIIPIEGCINEFAIGFSDRTVKKVYWNGKSVVAHIIETLFRVEQNPYYDENIWHVAKVDPYGRFYGGTMRKQLCTLSTAPKGSFYRYTQRKLKKLFGDVGISNGITWSKRLEKMFYIDACQFAINSYDYNIATGEISNGKKIYKLFEGRGVPTLTGLGLTIDTEDKVYVARYNGSSILKIDPNTSKVLKKFEIPTEIVINIAFGGPKKNELFVTTSRLPFDLFTGQLANDTLSSSAGFLFIIKDTGARGIEGTALRLG